MDDSASAHLVRAVAERLKGLLIVGASRPLDDTALAPAAPLLDYAAAEFITIGPLSSDEARTLLCRFLGVDRVDDLALTFILGRTGGHPFFIEELARALRRSDLLRIAGGAATLSERDIRKVTFPDSIQAAIVSQADRLSPHDLLALKIASVIGPSFSYEQLHTVYPVAEDRGSMHGALENLERLEFVARQGGDAAPSYVFRHALIQEAMYDVIPASQKRKVHASVASLHESRSDSARADLYPLLSHHWERAGNAAKAVFYLEKAADEAVKLFSSREAESFLERASELAKSDPELGAPLRAAVRERLRGEAAYQQAAYDRARQHFSLSLSLRDIRVPHTRAATTADLVAQILRQLAHRAVPARYIENRDDDRREALAHAALVFNRFSSLAWFRGDQLGLVHSIFKVLNLAEEAADVVDMVHGSAAMAVLCGLIGLDRAADFYCRRAIQLADDSKNPSNAARARINASIYAIGSGLWDQAEAHVTQSLDLHMRLGDRQHWEGSCALNGYLHLARGQFAKATSRFDEVYASALAGRAQSRVWARSGHIAAQLPRGPVPPGLIQPLPERPAEPRGRVARYRRGHHGARAHRPGAASCRTHGSGHRHGGAGTAASSTRKLGALWRLLGHRGSGRDVAVDSGGRPGAAPRRGSAQNGACGLLRAFARTMPMARPRAALYTDGLPHSRDGRAPRSESSEKGWASRSSCRCRSFRPCCTPSWAPSRGRQRGTFAPPADRSGPACGARCECRAVHLGHVPQAS